MISIFKTGTGAILCAILALVSLSLSGCASTQQAPVTSERQWVSPGQNPEMGWWYARFKIFWPAGENPAWHNDLLLASRVIAPVLERHRGQIRLWRFHRRAAEDESGHQFSFIFYSGTRDARKIFESIKSSIVLDELKTAGLIIKEDYDDTGRIIRPGIDGVSDKNWTLPLCRTWPYFIMGVSETWLALIQDFEKGGSPKPMRIEEMDTFYSKIDKEVREVWAREGRHAYLHHLNAVFGYAPMRIGGTEVRF